jgi:hypothetical protein
VFQNLSIFRGGIRREAAEQVTGATLLLLSTLVDKSLLRRTDAGRYEVHELLRQYASDKLDASGEAGQIRSRHVVYFMRWAEATDPQLRGRGQMLVLSQLEAEHDNVRAALEWALEGQASPLQTREAAWRLTAAMWWFWSLRGYWREMQRWLQIALAQTAGQRTAVRAKLLVGAVELGHFQRDGSAIKIAAEEGLAIWRDIGDQSWTSFLLVELGWRFLYDGDPTWARSVFEEAVALARLVEDKWFLANALRGLGAAMERVDLAAGRPILDESISIWREVGDKRG